MWRAKFKAKDTVDRLAERGVNIFLLSLYLNVDSGLAKMQQNNYYYWINASVGAGRSLSRSARPPRLHAHVRKEFLSVISTQLWLECYTLVCQVICDQYCRSEASKILC